MSPAEARSLDDETLEALASANQGGMGSWVYRDELTRRAEIRIERGEYGDKHDAQWYEPRQTA